MNESAHSHEYLIITIRTGDHIDEPLMAEGLSVINNFLLDSNIELVDADTDEGLFIFEMFHIMCFLGGDISANYSDNHYIFEDRD
jgi:hypothetical protein